MKPAFADTAYYLALLNEHDSFHSQALASLFMDRAVVTTEFILLELGNAMSRGPEHADFAALVKGLRDSPTVRIIPLSTELLDRGIQLMSEQTDKDWSLTDCISFEVMKELQLAEALTTDHHFVQAGFCALLR